MGIAILSVIALLGLGAVGYFVSLLIKEIIPTIEQAQSATNVLQSAIQESKEIGIRFQSINESIHRQREEAIMALYETRESLGQMAELALVVEPARRALVLFKRRNESKRDFVQPKNWWEKLQSKSREAWKQFKNPVQGRFSSRGKLLRKILIPGIPLIVGTAAGSYAAFILRRKRPQDSSHRLEQTGLRELAPPPSTSMNEQEKKKTTPNQNS